MPIWVFSFTLRPVLSWAGKWSTFFPLHGENRQGPVIVVQGLYFSSQVCPWRLVSILLTVQWTSLANDNAWNVTVTDHGHPVLARVMSYGVGICLCWPGPAWGIRLRCTCWNTAGSVIPNRHLNSLSQPGLGGRKPGFKLWLLYTQACHLTFWVTLSVTAGKHKYQLSNILRVRFNELIVSWIYKLFTEKQT